MQDIFKKTFDAVTIGEEYKQQIKRKLIETQNNSAASKTVNGKKRFTWNIRRSIVAVSTAAVFIFCAIFIPIILNNNGGGGGDLTQKEKMKIMFENAVYVPSLSDIMPSSILGVINLDTDNTPNNATQSTFNKISSLSAEPLKTLDISEIQGDKMLAQSFDVFMNRYQNIQGRSDGIKHNTVANIERISNFDVWENLDSDTKIKFEQLKNGVAYYYAAEWEWQSYFIRAVVYDDGSTECFYCNESGENEYERVYFCYNGIDHFVMLRESIGGYVYFMELKKQGEQFDGIESYLTKDETGGHIQMKLMQGDENEFNVVEYHAPFGESTWTAYNGFSGIKDKSAYTLSNNEDSVLKGSVTISLDALEGIEKIYYSEYFDGSYTEARFEALELTNGTLFDNTYYNGLYGYGASFRRSNEFFYGGLNIYLLEVNDDYTDVIAKYNAALPDGLKVKESKAFDFTIYLKMVEKIESYKITSIDALSNLILIENGDEIYTKIVEHISAMRYEIS